MLETDKSAVQTYRKEALVNPLLLNAILFFSIGCITVLSRGVTIALFTETVGSKALPYIYSSNAIIHLIIATAISFCFSKYSILKIIRIVFVCCFIIFTLATLMLMMDLSVTFSSTTLIIAGTRISSLAELLMWICATQFFSNQEAKKVYGGLLASYSLGIILGGALLTLFSKLINPEYFLILSCAGLLLNVILVHKLETRTWHKSYYSEETSSSISSFVKYIINSSSWGKLLLISVLIYGCYYISDFLFVTAAQSYFNNIQTLTAFFGFYEILSATVIILFAIMTQYLIKMIGIWYSQAFIVLMMCLAFVIPYFTGENIYAATITRIIIAFLFESSVILIGIICKNAKEKYQNITITFFDYVSVSLGTLMASVLGFMITFGLVSYNIFSLIMAIIALSIVYWIIKNKKTYIKVLYGSLENKELEELRDTKAPIDFTPASINYLYKAISLNGNAKEYQSLIYEIPIRISNFEIIKILLNILEDIRGNDPLVRKKALKALINYKSVSDLIMPQVIKCTEDHDIEVAGQAITTLYHFNKKLAKKHAINFLTKILSTEKIYYFPLAFKIISLLKINKFNDIIVKAMNNPEPKIRELAYEAFANVCEIDNIEGIKLLIEHLGEQNINASKALLKAINKLTNKNKYLFYDLMLTADPCAWKNSCEILIKWQCKSEYAMIVYSAINKIHLLFENIGSIQTLFELNNKYADIVAQHLVFQNQIIVKGALSIIAINSHDEEVIENLYKEIRNPNKNIRDTALELIENLGEKHLSKHLIAYLSTDNDRERCNYANRVWHAHTNSLQSTLSTLLIEKNEWMKACAIYLIATLRFEEYYSLLKKIERPKQSIFINSCLDKALADINGETKVAEDFLVDYLDIITFLRKTKVFENVYFDSLDEIIKSLKQIKYSTEEVIISQGEKFPGLYLIYQGTVTSNFVLNDSQLFPILVLNDHECIGAQYILNDQVSIETCVANSETIIFYIPNLIMKKHIYLHPEIVTGLLKEVAAYHSLIPRLTSEDSN